MASWDSWQAEELRQERRRDGEDFDAHLDNFPAAPWRTTDTSLPGMSFWTPLRRPSTVRTASATVMSPGKLSAISMNREPPERRERTPWKPE